MKSISPELPIISIAEGFSVKIIRNLQEANSFRFSDLYYQAEEQYAFDNLGCKWKYKLTAPHHKPSFWDQFKDPLIVGIIAWEKMGDYSINELKEMLSKEVEKNDTLTEHENGEFLKSKIKDALDLNAIISILDKYVFNVDEDALWREQEQR